MTTPTPIHAATGQAVSTKNAVIIASAARADDRAFPVTGPWATYRGWLKLGRQVPKGCRNVCKIVAPRGSDGDGGTRFGRTAVWPLGLTIPATDRQGDPVPPTTIPGAAAVEAVVAAVDAADPPTRVARTGAVAPRRAAKRVGRTRGRKPAAGSLLAAVAAAVGGDQ